MGQHLWIQKAETTFLREGVFTFQHTDYVDQVVVSKMLEGDGGRKVQVPQ